MKNKKKKSNQVPTLRFPEFKKAGNWEEKTLNDLLIEQVRETKKPNEPYTALGIRSHGKGTFLKEFQEPEKNSMELLYKVESNDLIVNITFAWEGAIAIVKSSDHGALVSHRFPTYTFISSETNANFFHYIIIRKDFVYKLFLISPGGAGRNRVMNKKDFLKIKVQLPKIKEQQKIADCLSTLDQLISLHTQKLDSLREYKKGLMEQLFPAEGETKPKLRFPEFKKSGNWEEKKLGEICIINPANKGLPNTFIYIDLESVASGNLLFKRKIQKENAPSRAQRLLECGDVIFQMVRPYQRNNFLYNFSDDNDYVASTGYAQLRPLHSSQFLFQMIHIDSFVEKVLSKCTGTSYPAINSTDLSEIEISIPFLPEQQKIADCLSSLDEIISSQAKKIEELKLHKKGLMQQLFPSVEEDNLL